MGEKFKIIRQKIGNSEEITITVPKFLESKEWFWLKEYDITAFDKAVINLETGQIVLKVATTIYDVEKEINSAR